MYLKFINTRDPLLCDFCGSAFAHPLRLVGHLFHSHLGRIRFLCDVCNKGFRSKKKPLRWHIAAIHQTERSYNCHVCGGPFGSRWKLAKHIRANHSNVRAFHCDICANVFSEARTLARHVLVVHWKTVRSNCKLCTKSFWEAGSLGSHIRAVHWDGRPLLFQCDDCKKVFRNKDAIGRHIRAVHRITAAAILGYKKR